MHFWPRCSAQSEAVPLSTNLIKLRLTYEKLFLLFSCALVVRIQSHRKINVEMKGWEWAERWSRRPRWVTKPAEWTEWRRFIDLCHNCLLTHRFSSLFFSRPFTSSSSVSNMTGNKTQHESQQKKRSARHHLILGSDEHDSKLRLRQRRERWTRTAWQEGKARGERERDELRRVVKSERWCLKNHSLLLFLLASGASWIDGRHRLAWLSCKFVFQTLFNTFSLGF